MKKKLLSILTCGLVLILSFTGCGPLTKSIGKGRDSIKILSYNVRNCRGMDDSINYHRIADIITYINPDAVVLQELDSATMRSNRKAVLDELALLTGMNKTYGASIEFQGGKYGIGVLTKDKPVSWKVIPLPGREEKRGLLIVELNGYLICSTHFSLTEEDRVASVEIINNALKDYIKPVFLGGDFNAVPGSEVITNIEQRWFMLNNPENPTIPSNNPQRCIDFIFAANYTGHTFVTKQTMVEDEPVASDHLPVWVEVAFK